jgi:alcohol dehydrogenase class IV
VCDLHHGLANGIMIPHAMAFNAEAVPQKLADLATAVRAPGGDFVAWLVDLKAAIGIPRGLREAGVAPDKTDRLVEIAVADGCHPNNPRPVTAPDFRRIFDRALA